MSGKPPLLFREEQRFRQPRIWVLLAILPVGFTLLLIWQVVLGHPAGRHPMSNSQVIGWTVFLWLVYLRLITIKLVTIVVPGKAEPGKLSVSLRGLWTIRRIPLAEVGKTEVVSYAPAADYGGYGIRLTRRGKAYIASGDRGVRFTLLKGGRVLVGSQRPEELAEAIAAACHRESPDQ
jgi:hypothetical protein